MIAQPYHLYVERTEADKNMARFYALSIEPSLLAGLSHATMGTQRKMSIDNIHQAFSDHTKHAEQA